MNEKLTSIIKVLVVLVAFVLGVFLVVYGRIIPGWSGLGVMVIGVVDLLTLLYLYNRKYK